MTQELARRIATDIVERARSVVMPETAQLHEPEFRGNEWAYLKDCLDSTYVSSIGPYIDQFETMLAEYTGAERAIAVVNGTAALHVSLILAGVEAGDEVLVPALTFIATANATSYAGATPHFIDSDNRLGVDSDELDRYLGRIAVIRDEVCVNLQTGRTIRAVMPMHTFGHPVDMDALTAVANRWRLVVVEDAAEALGSSYRGRPCGTLGRIGALSFNGNKIATTGGGGAIITNDVGLGKLAKHLTTTARVPHRWSFIHDRIGFNYRMPNINAALGCAQLERMPDVLARKRVLAGRYISAFADCPYASVVEQPTGTISNYWLVALQLTTADIAVRDAVLEALNEDGLKARPIWTLMHELPIYANCPRMPLGTAECLEAQLINLPSSPMLADH